MSSIPRFSVVNSWSPDEHKSPRKFHKLRKSARRADTRLERASNGNREALAAWYANNVERLGRMRRIKIDRRFAAMLRSIKIYDFPEFPAHPTFADAVTSLTHEQILAEQRIPTEQCEHERQRLAHERNLRIRLQRILSNNQREWESHGQEFLEQIEGNNVNHDHLFRA